MLDELIGAPNAFAYMKNHYAQSKKDYIYAVKKTHAIQNWSPKVTTPRAEHKLHGPQNRINRCKNHKSIIYVLFLVNPIFPDILSFIQTYTTVHLGPLLWAVPTKTRLASRPALVQHTPNSFVSC